jgi:hypothetical protein
MNAILQLALADFRERVRRFGFLLVVALAVFLGYQVISGFFELRLGSYRGLLNAAWIGTLMALTLSFFLSMVGFYVVRGNVQRDRQTGVGQILAATPLSKLAYVLGKFASNAAVLMLVIAVLALSALVMLLIHGEDKNLNLYQLWMPFLIFSLPVALFVAAIAVFFECTSFLSGSPGNVIYFFLWFFIITPIGGDILAFNTIEQGMTIALQSQGATYAGGIVLGAGGSAAEMQTFLWTGFDWLAVAESRLVYVLAALLIAGAAALTFERFDTTAGHKLSARFPHLSLSGLPNPFRHVTVAIGSDGLQSGQLSPVQPSSNFFNLFATLVVAELKLLLKGRSPFWYVVAVILIAACLLSPLETVRVLLPIAWLWPLLLWSEMGARARCYQVEPLFLSAPTSLWMQLPATWAAGVLLALILGSGALVRFASAPQFLPGFFAGALFFPAFALFLGMLSGTERPFQILALIGWYLGPLNGLAAFDITTATDPALVRGSSWLYLSAAPVLMGLAFLARRYRQEL